MSLEKRFVKLVDGEYIVDIDVTVDEWKEMLQNRKVFYSEALYMVNKWYLQDGCLATNKEIMMQNKDKYQNNRGAAFVGTVVSLGKRIIKHLQRFETFGTTGIKTYWCIPFEGWEDYSRRSGTFVWKLRKELVQAIDELNLFDVYVEEKEETTVIFKSEAEGKTVMYYTQRYERSQRNRNAAKDFHGTTCCVCGFNFEKVYGKRGREYIEVHHNKPLHRLDEEIKPDIKKDFDVVCANCHRMLHRSRNEVLTVKQLKKELRYHT